MVNNVVIENARLMFRNFAGKETKFNRSGNRNFCVILDDLNQVERLREEGWNVRTLAARDEDEEPRYYISVTVNFDNRPPHIWMISGKNKIALDEDGVDALDYAEIKNADVVLNGYEWEVSGKSGVKAYLKSMYVTIEEDPFADKYVDDMPF